MRKRKKEQCGTRLWPEQTGLGFPGTGILVGLCVPSLPISSGPQNCAACVHEGLYEEGISILESSSVSTLY